MNTGQLRDMVSTVLQTMRETEPRSEKTTEYYARYGFGTIERHFEAAGIIADYSATEVNSFVHAYRSDYERGAVSYFRWKLVRRSAALLEAFHKTRQADLPQLPPWPWPTHRLTGSFDNLLEQYCEYASRVRRLGDTTIKNNKSIIRGFLTAVEDAGMHSPDAFSLKHMGDAVTALAHKYSGGTRSMVYAVRCFLRFLHESGLTQTDFSIAVPEFVSPRRTVHEGYGIDEIRRILDAPNRSTAVGCRDYAMMTLAAQTGLRSIDITHLRRGEIDWRRNEISIVQSKTGKALRLPLEPESGNAVADYLLHYRPDSDLPFVFLCSDKPLRPLAASTFSDRVFVYKRIAKIDPTIPWRRAHGFRRAFGTRLLETETPIDLLIQLLGHSHMDSARPYLSASEQGLKGCALSLAAVAKAGERW